MPNYIDDGDFRHADRFRSTRHGAVRRQRQLAPVYCEYEYEDAPEGEELCGNKAVRHSDPPRCTKHGGVNAEFSRKRTEAGYVRVSPGIRQLIEHPELITSLDDEELARGQLRNKNGNFSGGAPQLVPRELYAKMTSELFKRADEKMKTNLVAAAEMLGEIVKNDDVDIKDRLKAAQWLIERVMGKTPEQVNITQDKPWQTILTDVTQDGVESYESAVKKEEDGRF